MPGLIATWIGGLLGVLLMATILAWILKKVLPLDPKVIAAGCVVVAAVAAPALYAFNSDGTKTYWDTAAIYLSAGVVAIPIMLKMTRPTKG